jgi:N-formylglutamate deformylase
MTRTPERLEVQMDRSLDVPANVVEVLRPRIAAVPLVVDSPHSGREYPRDFRHDVDRATLRRLEDGFVDLLLAGAPTFGATSINAHFPRSYIDPNRAEFDLDPHTLSDEWNAPASPSHKSKLGVGLVFTRTLDGQDIYARPLQSRDIHHRLEHYYRPYHRALSQVLDETHAAFGMVWHLNCHSMPALAAGSTCGSRNRTRPDFCLGDRHGTTCSPALLECAAACLRGMGYCVSINDPYAGVELVARHGRPEEGRHSLQIEINRSLYMNEAQHTPHRGLPATQAALEQLMAFLADQLRSTLAIAAE